MHPARPIPARVRSDAMMKNVTLKPMKINQNAAFDRLQEAGERGRSLCGSQ